MDKIYAVEHRVAVGNGPITKEITTLVGTREAAEAFASECRKALPAESKYVKIVEFARGGGVGPIMRRFDVGPITRGVPVDRPRRSS
jgi:hypothetical protein